jgi:flagellar export protein FliJ
MRRFRFRLESIRSLRAHSESAARTVLAREIAVGATRAAELEQADAALASARGGETAARTAASLAARQTFLERRERERNAAATALQAQQQVVADRSADLATAAAERAALDRLRERKQDLHRRDAARAEDAALGEIGLAQRGPLAGGRA